MRVKPPARRKRCGAARGADNPSDATNGSKKPWSDLGWRAPCTNRDDPRKPRLALPGFLLQKTVPDTLSPSLYEKELAISTWTAVSGEPTPCRLQSNSEQRC